MAHFFSPMQKFSPQRWPGPKYRWLLARPTLAPGLRMKIVSPAEAKAKA